MGSDMNSIGSRDDSNDNESDAFVAQLMEAIEPGFAPNEDLGPFNRFDPNTNDPPPNQATSPQRPTLQFNECFFKLRCICSGYFKGILGRTLLHLFCSLGTM